MNKLRANPIIAARDFYYSYVIYEEELRLSQGSTYFSRLWDCFAIPRIRRSNYGASTVMIAQQMCGINSTYAPRAPPPPQLMRSSHLLLQLHHLSKCWIHCDSGTVRVAGLRRRPGRFHHPDAVPNRHKGPQNAHSCGKPLTQYKLNKG